MPEMPAAIRQKVPKIKQSAPLIQLTAAIDFSLPRSSPPNKHVQEELLFNESVPEKRSTKAKCSRQ
jgi:hypothetical protein